MPTLTADYLDDQARVRLDAGDLLPGVVYAIRRSSDQGATWETVRGATNITDGGVTVVYDYEYAPMVENRYELVQPLVSDTFEREAGGGFLAAAADQDTSDTAVAPSIDAPMAGMLICAWTSGHESNSPYTLPVSMSPVVQQTGASVTNAVATELVAAGPTGTRSATAGTASSWSAVSVVAVGPDVAIADAVWGMSGDDDPDPGVGVSVTTGAVDAGVWLIAIYATDWDGSDEMQAPLGGGWELLAASEPLGSSGEFLVSRTTAWAKQVTTSGPQTVEVADTPSSEENFLTVLAISGSDGAPLGWGSADTGQPWLEQTNSGPGVVWSVSGGAGRLTVPEDAPPAPFNWGRYLPVDYTDMEVQYDLIIPSGDSSVWQWRLNLRGTDAAFDGGYDVIFDVSDDGPAEIGVFTGDGPARSVQVGTWQVGQRWRVKARLVGSVLEAKAWNTANREPSTWQIVATSTNAASGTVSINFNGEPPAEFIIDDFMVRGVPPLAVANAAVTPMQPDVWLKSPTHPSLNVNLGCVATGPRTRRSRVGLFDVKGQSEPVGIADVGSTETFVLIFATHSPEENMAVAGLLTYGPPLLLQSPPDADPEGCGNLAAYPSGWFMPGDNTEARMLPGRRVWEWQVPLTRVKRPSPHGVTPAHMTWSVLWQMVNNWVELWDEWATWAELWNANVAPAVMYRALSGGDL